MDLEVLIVGGGIHGVGLLHDLATRRIPGVHLVESKVLASGTSSRSTKMVHGGLRYLEHVGQWGLVRESLQERGILLRVLRGIVQPLPVILPIFPQGRPAWMLRAGLFLYDSFAGDGGLPPARALSIAEIESFSPYFKREQARVKSAFMYYDAQMVDDAIVRIAAHAAQKLGATFSENTAVKKVVQKPDGGFKVTLLSAQNGEQEVSCRYLINAAGAWCNANLIQWGFVPQYSCLLNLGSHLIFPAQAVLNKASECAAMAFQNTDGRIVFFIPWQGRWILGTTESILPGGEPRALKMPESDRNYLYKIAQEFLNLKPYSTDQVEEYCGVRTMPLNTPTNVTKLQDEWLAEPFSSPFYVREMSANISALSRETIVDERVEGLFSIYGGKYTSYRSQSEKLGSLISRRLGKGATCGTQDSHNWFLTELLAENPDIFISSPEVRKL